MNREDAFLVQALFLSIAFGSAFFLLMKNALPRIPRVSLTRFKLKKRVARWPRLVEAKTNVLQNFFYRRRRKKLVAQLPDALDALASALRAGYALPYACALVEREAHPPISRVFGALARAHEYELSLKDAAAMIRPQVGAVEWDYVAEALEMHDGIGGNFIPVLAEAAHSLREKLRVDAEVASATASGRVSGLIVAALAPVSFVTFYFFSPSYMSILFTSTLGVMLLASAVILEAIGFIFIWKIISIDY